MCGIAGLIGSARTDVAACSARMSQALAHRGPDDSDIKLWRDERLEFQTAFVHRRLSIIDLSSAARQPMTTRDGRFTAILNGEIYNYRELRQELESHNVQFATASDTEVLLELYARRGIRFLDALRGMFAVAIRENETGELFIARDRLGIKPLYYAQLTNEGSSAGAGFIFGSEIRALLASGCVPRVLDRISVNSYLSFGAVQEPRTIVEGVRSLPAAHYMRVSAQGQIKEVSRYWTLPTRTFAGDRVEAVSETRRLLETSIAAHLVTDVPLGAFLSGGIDSTSIAALMRRRGAQTKTFTVVFEENEFSERDEAREVADVLATDHTEIMLTEGDLLSQLPQAVADLDQPTIDGINTWVVARATRAAGITVALSGLGGDELFGGYPSFRRAGIMQRVNSLVKTGAERRLARAAVALMGDSLRAQKLAASLAAGDDLLASYASMRGLFARDKRKALLGLQNGKAADANEHYYLPEETLSLVSSANGKETDTFNQISRYEMSLYMANMLLRDTDVMSMAHALEVRVPLLDHELVEWVYALPGDLKTGSQAKQLLVDALGSDLPSSVLNRRKTGFALPFERWLHTALKPFVQETLGNDRNVRAAGLDPKAVDEVVRSFERGAPSTSWSRVWGLTMLVDWVHRNQVVSDE